MVKDLEPIRIDEVLAELERLTAAVPDGITRHDIESHFKISERSAQGKLRAWVRGGRLVHCGFRDALSVDKKRYRLPLYRPVPESGTNVPG